MANSVDFRADQVQVNKIVVTGSNAGSSEAILVYGITNQTTPLNEGNVNLTKFPTGSIGSDVFFYVSGGIGGKDVSGGAISVFGGDLHISGGLTVDGPFGGTIENAINALTASLVSGSVIALTPITGTISGTLAGLPFIVAGPNVRTNYYASTGQWAVSASLTGAGVTPGGSDGQIQWNNANNFDGLSVLTYDGSTLQGTGSFSGSFQGTFSGVAANAVTASFATTASFASQALSASYASNALSASYAANALSASFATTATSASYANNALSASYASQALSASYADNALSASYASQALSASYADNALSASYASQALSASYADNALSASYASQALSASYADAALSASYASQALSASYSDFALSASHADYAETAGTASVALSSIQWQDGGNKLATTSSVALAGALGTGYFADNVDPAINLFVSGTAVVGGNLVVSGTLETDNIVGNILEGSKLTADYIELVNVVDEPTPSVNGTYIYSSGSTNDLYVVHNNGALNKTNFRWVENALGTGLLQGGILSTEAGTTAFSVTAGEGLILSYNATTSSAPDAVITKVNWDTFTSQSLTYINSAPQTFVGISDTGALIQQTTPFTTDQYALYIPLGRILHISGATTYGIANQPRVAYGQSSWNGDFARSFGPLKLSGHVLAASGSTLSIVKTGGSAYAEGKNYSVDPNNPNVVQPSSDGPVIISKIFREFVSGSDSTQVIVDTNGGIGFTDIDPNNYNPNNAGTLTPVTPGRFTIQRVYWAPNSSTNAFWVYYGSGEYNSLIEAQAGIPTEIFQEGTNTIGATILVANILVASGATDLSNPAQAQFVQGGLFRGSGTGIGGAGGATVPGGLDTYIQFNDGGSTFGGDPGFTYNKTTDTMTVENVSSTTITASTGISSSGTLEVGGNTVLTTVTASNLNVTGTFTSTGPVIASGGLSGSLQNLADGSSYLVAGPNITVNTASSGQVSITGSIGGSDRQVQYNNNGLFGGVSTLTYDGSLLQATGSFSGSFQGTLAGTASYALNSLSSSYAENALSASYATNALSASYATNALSASYASNALSASYATNALSASYATAAENANTVGGQSLSGLAQLNTSNTFTQNNIFTTASGSFSGSYQGVLTGTASYALTAGLAQDSNLLDGLHSYQYAQLAANNTFAGNNIFQFGLSGSLQKLSDGTNYLAAGPNITINTASNGQVRITGSIGGANTQIQYNNDGLFGGVPTLTYNGVTLQASGAFSGSLTATTVTATSISSSGNVSTQGNLFVQGNTQLTGAVNLADGLTATGQILTTGNLVIQGNTQLTGAVNLASTLSASGQISTANNLRVQGNTQLTGAVNIGGQLTASAGLNLTGASSFAAGSTFIFNGNSLFTNGLSGSLQSLSDGVTPYLLGGPNIVLTTQSNGQIAITGAATASAGAGGLNTQIQYNNLGALAGLSQLTYTVAGGLVMTASNANITNAVITNLTASNVTASANVLVGGNLTVAGGINSVISTTAATVTPYVTLPSNKNFYNITATANNQGVTIAAADHVLGRSFHIYGFATTNLNNIALSSAVAGTIFVKAYNSTAGDYTLDLFKMHYLVLIDATPGANKWAIFKSAVA
jgi:hypothetical protein